tara:strand:- start:410 stop:673 length:264 start_codon:yes stop_codon:yes gene_type:complete
MVSFLHILGADFPCTRKRRNGGGAAAPLPWSKNAILARFLLDIQGGAIKLCPMSRSCQGAKPQVIAQFMVGRCARHNERTGLTCQFR